MTIIEDIVTDENTSARLDVPANKASRTIALVGAPNAGKSTLFNGLTGGNAKVANYPGVTVETRAGVFETPGGARCNLIDLPGIYGFSARSTDARVALSVVKGQTQAFDTPDLLMVVIDAAQLRTHLQTVLQMVTVGKPMIVVLNMFDLATRDGLEIDIAALEQKLGVPVVPATSTRTAVRSHTAPESSTLSTVRQTPNTTGSSRITGVL